jgi:hypothetical protein
VPAFAQFAAIIKKRIAQILRSINRLKEGNGMLTARKITFIILFVALLTLMSVLVYRTFFAPDGEGGMSGARFVYEEVRHAL